jgi:hypothetical protein
MTIELAHRSSDAHSRVMKTNIKSGTIENGSHTGTMTGWHFYPSTGSAPVELDFGIKGTVPAVLHVGDAITIDLLEVA